MTTIGHKVAIMWSYVGSRSYQSQTLSVVAGSRCGWVWHCRPSAGWWGGEHKHWCAASHQGSNHFKRCLELVWIEAGLSQTLKNGRRKCNKCQKWNQRGHQRWAVSTLGRWREIQRQGEKGRNTNSSQDIPQRWLKEWLQPFWLDIWWWEFEILLNLKWQRYIFFFPGNTSIKLIKYPKTILGGKSNPKLKNLKPFIKVSYTSNTVRL